MKKDVKVLISEEEIGKRINELAKDISTDYNNEDIILVCVLKGSMYFTADLSKRITNNNVIIDFIKVSSYDMGSTESSGTVKLHLDLNCNIEGKNVIILEDIIDTGITLNYLRNYLESKKPKSLKICALLDKPERRKVAIDADYVGFKIENKFIVGYGMDYNDEYRNLPYIGYLDN